MRHGHREITGRSRHSLFKTQLLKWVGGTGTGSKYGAVYRDGSASVDPLHALVVDNSDEVWSVGGLDYVPLAVTVAILLVHDCPREHLATLVDGRLRGERIARNGAGL
jgi:hypothetical protein